VKIAVWHLRVAVAPPGGSRSHPHPGLVAEVAAPGAGPGRARLLPAALAAKMVIREALEGLGFGPGSFPSNGLQMAQGGFKRGLAV